MVTSIAGTAPVVAPVVEDRASPHVAARQHELIERYHHLLTRPDGELRDALASMIRAEQALPEGDRYAVTFARLRAWLAMDREDARIIARAFEEAMERFSPEQREERMAAERAVILNGLRFAEFRALCGIVPWLRSEESLQLLFPEIVPGSGDVADGAAGDAAPGGDGDLPRAA